MLTPAEEVGLAGSRLAARVQRALRQIPEPEQRALLAQIEEESRVNHLWYLREGRPETIRVLGRPLTVLPDQLGYIHAVSLTLTRVLKRLPDLYLHDPRVRQILQLPPDEDAWFRECWGPAHREENPVFGRLDAVADFTSAHWKETLRFLEPNMSCIGGLHLLPTADRILARVLVPALRSRDPGLDLAPAGDIRDLLMQYMLDHLEAIDRPGRIVCFVEPKYAGDGPDEQSALAAYFREHFQLEVLHADPSELRCQGGDVTYEGRSIDVAYRDYSVAELLELERTGIDVSPMRRLLRENRMISSIAAEMDQKACWEVLTDPELARDHFTTEERLVFRRHVLWTRVVSERKTMLPDATTGDLLEYARVARESLVLKPNRSYGGKGVALGAAISEGDWAARIDQALADPERWVVQQITPLPVYDFPTLEPGGHVGSEAFYTVLGFAPTSYGVAILGRASQKQVVNIAQRGGLCPVLVCRGA